MTGRPSLYSDELVDAICERLAEGESLLEICKDAGMPTRSTVFNWLREKPDFVDKYARAREAQADGRFDEIVRIADTCDDPAKARVQIDARKWVAGKLAPKKYGDVQRTEHTGADGGPIQHSVTAITRKVIDAGGTGN